MHLRALYWLSAIFAILGVNLKDLIQYWPTYPLWAKTLLFLSLFLAVVFLIGDLWARHKATPKRYKDSESVNKYMLRLLQRGGSAWIFANNLTWVRNSTPVRNFIVKQAKSGKDIRIFVPRHNEITRDLASNGVTIITYETLEYEPEARFTLLNPKEPGSSLLAIGKGTLPNFYIEEFPDLTHSRAISVARDLFQIVERTCGRGLT